MVLTYAMIESSMWSADADLESWPPLARYLYMYYSSCPLCDWLTGIYRPPVDRVVMAETGLTRAQLAKYRKFLLGTGKLVEVDGWLWVVGKGNHGLMGPKQARGVACRLEGYPAELSRSFVSKYLGRLRELGLNGELQPYLDGIDTVSDTVSIGCDHNDTKDEEKKERHGTKAHGSAPRACEAGSFPEKNGGCSGSDSSRRSGEPSELKSALQVPGESLAMELAALLCPRGPKRQMEADLTCLRRMETLVAVGGLGPDAATAGRMVLARAKSIAGTRSVRKPVAVLMQWFKAELEKHGRRW